MKTINNIKPCDGYEEMLILSRYGELGPEEEKRVGAHLSGCPACRAYMDGLRETLVPMPETLPGQFAAKKAARGVMERISAKQTRPAYTRYLAPAFATLALAVVIAWAAVWSGMYQTTVNTGTPAPANVIANTTGYNNDTLSDVEIARNIDMLADLELMEDIDTLDRIEQL